jgi:hypothetical protein
MQTELFPFPYPTTWCSLRSRCYYLEASHEALQDLRMSLMKTSSRNLLYSRRGIPYCPASNVILFRSASWVRNNVCVLFKMHTKCSSILKDSSSQLSEPLMHDRGIRLVPICSIVCLFTKQSSDNMSFGIGLRTGSANGPPSHKVSIFRTTMSFSTPLKTVADLDKHGFSIVELHRRLTSQIPVTKRERFKRPVCSWGPIPESTS